MNQYQQMWRRVKCNKMGILYSQTILKFKRWIFWKQQSDKKILGSVFLNISPNLFISEMPD